MPRRLALSASMLLLAAAAVVLLSRDGHQRARATLAPGGVPATDSAGGDARLAAPAELTEPVAVATTVARGDASAALGNGAIALTVEAVDGSTGRAIAAFFVTALPAAVHAQGRAGVAELTGLAAGSITLEAQGPEHEAVSHTVSLPRAGPVILRLPQRTGARGVVRFADARPAADVVLRLEATPTSSASGPAPEIARPAGPRDVAQPTLAKTDADGHYRFAPLAPGEYSFVVEHMGRRVSTLGPVQVTSGMLDLPEVRLEAGGRLEVEALDQSGLPRKEVLVVLIPADAPALRRYTTADGRLILEPLPPGNYTLVVPAQDTHAEVRKTVELRLGLHRETLRAEPQAAASGAPLHSANDGADGGAR